MFIERSAEDKKITENFPAFKESIFTIFFHIKPDLDPNWVFFVCFFSLGYDKKKRKISFSTQLNIKFILLINVKMPTIGCILTFISMINTASESSKAREVNTFQQFTFCGRLKFQ